jgi:hypothetical protein
MLKIDLAKDFDRVEWNFIVQALARKGLHGHFINLIHACIPPRLSLSSSMANRLRGSEETEVSDKDVLYLLTFLFWP